MNKIVGRIKKYQNDRHLTDEKVANKLDISIETYNEIMATGEISDESLFKKIDIILDAKSIKRSEKIRRLIELIFRIGGIVTAMASFLLCIAGKTECVLTLLSISALCTSASILPKK